MKRIGIAVVLGLLGILLLPAMKDAIGEVAGVVSAGMIGQKGDAFIQLIADNAYLFVGLLWIIAIGAVIFWPHKDENKVTRG